MTSGSIDVARVIRTITVALAILAGSLVYLGSQPDIDALGARLDEARTELRADDIALAQTRSLRAERDQLRRRYERAFSQSGESVFLRDLATTTRRHGTRVVSTSTTEDGAQAQVSDQNVVSTSVGFTIELHGAYRNLLASIVDLSREHALVRVQTPSFRRVGDALDASLPVTLYQPALGAR